MKSAWAALAGMDAMGMAFSYFIHSQEAFGVFATAFVLAVAMYHWQRED